LKSNREITLNDNNLTFNSTTGNVLFSSMVTGSSVGLSANLGITTASDARLKENIKPYAGPSALKGINAIEIVEYDWKAIKPSNLKRHVPIGVIAQDVQKVFPDAVGVDSKSGNLMVHTTLFSFYLMKATQELTKEVEALKKENQALNERMNKLETLMKHMLHKEKK
ncbi:MAG: tail fiber domain-containing protein, partial [Chitinophagaceae bacterium]